LYLIVIVLAGVGVDNIVLVAATYNGIMVINAPYTFSLPDALPIWQIGRFITISTTPVIAGDSFEMDAVGALRLEGVASITGVVRSEERFSRNARDRSRMPSSA